MSKPTPRLRPAPLEVITSQAGRITEPAATERVSSLLLSLWSDSQEEPKFSSCSTTSSSSWSVPCMRACTDFCVLSHGLCSSPGRWLLADSAHLVSGLPCLLRRYESDFLCEKLEHQKPCMGWSLFVFIIYILVRSCWGDHLPIYTRRRILLLVLNICYNWIYMPHERCHDYSLATMRVMSKVPNYLVFDWTCYENSRVKTSIIRANGTQDSFHSWMDWKWTNPIQGARSEFSTTSCVIWMGDWE